MTHRLRCSALLVPAALLAMFVLLLLVTACGSGEPTGLPPTNSPTPPARATDTPPTATEAPPTEPVAEETVSPITTELRAMVEAGLPQTPTPESGEVSPWGPVEIGILSLASGADGPPLWAAYSMGMGFYDPDQGHFVAVYTWYAGSWHELDRIVLAGCAEFVDQGALSQVELEPSQVWLALQSGAGAHGGCYDVIRFDGQQLHLEASHAHSSPDAGGLADLDGNGTLEVILDETENYVFCYACGVRLPFFRVLRWNGTGLEGVELRLLPDRASDEVGRLNNRAVELAQGQLWLEAREAIDAAQRAGVEDAEAAASVRWNEILIRLHADARAEQAHSGIYPLLENAFYGDYAAVLDSFRAHDAGDIWRTDSPLLTGSVAEGWEVALSDWISWTTNLALDAEPGLAAAHFLQSWGLFLRSPDDVAVLEGVRRAAELAPDEPLFASSVAFLSQPEATPAELPAPTRVPTPAVQATHTPAPEEPAWTVRSLLAGPGTPGRLYAMLGQGRSVGDAEDPVRLLVSDDDGQTWTPFSGGLPASGCVRNLNMDYATPDRLYASTCQGLFLWSGGAWQPVSAQETGMVAIVYGQPEVIWATEPFGPGGGVLRSDDGGVSWTSRSSGLINFNGVATVAVDPRDANTLYAVIWPKYAGSYLRRGTADGQWQVMPTPEDNRTIGTGITIDGATGALYVVATSPQAQLWRSQNPAAPDLNDVVWELVHDFGREQSVELLASGWSPEGLALYANFWPLTWVDENMATVGDAVLHRSTDGGKTWSALPIP